MKPIRSTPILAICAALATSGCGSDSSGAGSAGSSGAAGGDGASGSGGSSGASPAVTACELFPETEAEAIVGADLELIPASDDYRCSYGGDPVGSVIPGAGLTILRGTSDASDIEALASVYGEGTVESVEGLGEAAIYHEDGALHDLQFVKNGVWVTITVSGMIGSEDYRTAEMQVAEAAAARL